MMPIITTHWRTTPFRLSTATSTTAKMASFSLISLPLCRILLLSFLTINLTADAATTSSSSRSRSSSSSPFQSEHKHQESENDNNNINTAVSTECIPSNEEYTTYHCLNGSKSRIDCIDTNEECPKWALRGECTKNPQYMLIQVRTYKKG